jgi:integrase
MPKAKQRDGVYYRKDRSAWAVSYIDASGNRKRRMVAVHTRQQAMDALSAIKTQEERARILGVRPASSVTLEALLERYTRHQKPRIRPTTFVRLAGILATLKAHLPEQAKSISKRTIAEYIETRSETVKAATVAKEMSVLKHCLKLAVEWELLHTNPAAGARLPKLPAGRTKYLTPGELKAALEAAPVWLRGPMAFAACTGVRRGEMLSLRWMDVDMLSRRVYLRETKNGALRILPLSEAAICVLASLPKGATGDLVFEGVDAARLSVYTKRVFARLGIPDASFHTLRHTSASWLVQQGVDLYAVGQLLGHKTPRMTARYAHLSPEYMAGAVGKLNGIMGDMLSDSLPGGLHLVTTASPEFGPAVDVSRKLLK